MFTWNVLTDKIIKSGKKTKRSSKGIMRAKIIEIESSLNNFWNTKVFWKNLFSLDFSVEVISEKIKNERFGRNIGQNIEIGEEIGAPLIELNRQIDNNDFEVEYISIHVKNFIWDSVSIVLETADKQIHVKI